MSTYKFAQLRMNLSIAISLRSRVAAAQSRSANRARALVCHTHVVSDRIHEIKLKLMYTESFSQSPTRAINKASPKNGSN